MAWNRPTHPARTLTRRYPRAHFHPRLPCRSSLVSSRPCCPAHYSAGHSRKRVRLELDARAASENGKNSDCKTVQPDTHAVANDAPNSARNTTSRLRPDLRHHAPRRLRLSRIVAPSGSFGRRDTTRPVSRDLQKYLISEHLELIPLKAELARRLIHGDFVLAAPAGGAAIAAIELHAREHSFQREIGEAIDFDEVADLL